MKADQAMGLVSAGSVNQSFLSRMPAILARLGPVKASSAQAARRVVKTLHAGYAISHYSALELCPLIWISVPEARLDRVVHDLASQMPVHRTMVVVCGCVRESTWPNPLQAAGARMASLNAIEEPRDLRFVAEGHPDTLRAIKRVLVDDKRKLVELRPSAKPLYFAGTHLATNLLLPWVDAAVAALRTAGFSRSDATEITEARVQRILRMYDNAGNKAWNGPLVHSLRKSLERDLEIVGAQNPQVATVYGKGVRLALDYFSSASMSA